MGFICTDNELLFITLSGVFTFEFHAAIDGIILTIGLYARNWNCSLYDLNQSKTVISLFRMRPITFGKTEMR